jgi:diaminohydroxyphosphoribosylaminopyrimidine deaminase / 5-amino-6-(5-phosphoribosylamino)uracil reductase
VLQTQADHAHLARAIELAGHGAGRVSPNPLVGAVVVRDGEVLGEGWHERYGEAHAEVNAIAACGAADLRGATLYVSLEPCCHQGRQPPCTDAILAAGISRVVVAAGDPSEKASGRGPGILRDEGVMVDIAQTDLAARAQAQNQPFRKHARTGRPWVMLKSAMSLDGKVATRTGDSKWISSKGSRELVHRWRAEMDAVAVGIGTALADDPLLTARGEDVERQPLRVIFDSTARLPPGARAVHVSRQAPLVVVASRAARRAATEALASAGAEVIVATGGNEPSRICSALDQLGSRYPPVTSVLLEGGPRLAGSFLDAGEIDEVRLFVAPLLVGSRSARDPVEGEGAERIADAVRPLAVECERIGPDVLLRARLKEW